MKEISRDVNYHAGAAFTVENLREGKGEEKGEEECHPRGNH